VVWHGMEWLSFSRHGVAWLGIVCRGRCRMVLTLVDMVCRCVAYQHIEWHGTASYSLAWHGIVWHDIDGVAWLGLFWFGLAWLGLAFIDMLWRGEAMYAMYCME
jgi:hypothetical protein